MPDDDDQDFQTPGTADDTVLPQDDDPPFSPPRYSDDSLYSHHQSTDDDLDETELYNEGVAGAAEQERPDRGAVVSYTPPDSSDKE